MAKGVSPYLSEIRGTVSKKLTFRHLKTKAGQVLQQIPIPSYRRTDKQDAVRTGYRRLCDLWKNATWIDKEVYNYFADLYALTSFNTFLKFNLPVMTKRPVLYLALDEGSGTVAHDYSVHQNDGTITGATWQKTANNKNVLYFDGIDDYVEVPDSPSLNPTDEITVIIWVKPAVAAPPAPTGLALKHTWWGEYGIIWEDSGRVSFPVGESDLTYTKPFSTKKLPAPDIWTMITLTAKAYEYVRGYFNTELVAEATMDHAIGDSIYPLSIGKYSNGYYNGIVGLVCVCERAISQEEIKQIYEITKPLFK